MLLWVAESNKVRQCLPCAVIFSTEFSYHCSCCSSWVTELPFLAQCHTKEKHIHRARQWHRQHKHNRSRGRVGREKASEGNVFTNRCI